MIEVIYKNVFPKDYLTKEENKIWFIKYLRRDILKAVELWDKKHLPEYKIGLANSFVEGIERVRTRATKEAEERYKTERKRTEYINECLANYITSASKELNECSRYNAITFFDIDLEPWTNSINGHCILNVNNLSDEKLEACWNAIKDNVYFKEAEGWRFEYDGCCRPQIKLQLPKNIQKQFDAEEEGLNRAIDNFYKGCKYWGD